MILGAARRARRFALANYLGEGEGPLGELANRGHDLRRLIAAETSQDVLAEALKRTRKVGDTRWTLEISRRLWDLGAEPAVGAQLVRDLTGAFHRDEAAKVFSALDASSIGARQYAELGFGLAVLRADFASARSNLVSAFGSYDAVPARLRVWFVEALLKAGHFGMVANEARDGAERHPEEARFAALAVRAALALDGAGAALDVLSESLPSGSVLSTILSQEILLIRGRYREALDRITEQIESSPRTWEFYAQAELAAIHCDRIDDYADLMRRFGELNSGMPEMTHLQCRLAADRNDFDHAGALLPKVRAVSDWTYRALRLHIACQQGDAPAIEAGYRACVEAGIRNAGPEMSFAQFTYFFSGTPENLRKALDLLAPYTAQMADNVAFLQGLFRLQIACGEEQACRNHYAALPKGLTQTAVLAPFGAYFDARDGRHEAAVRGWRRYIAEAAPEQVNAVSSYPETIRLRYEETPGAVLLFLTVFNGIEFIDWFLNHYRNLGVDHFFVVDNGSDDGTFERLLDEIDVSVFRNTGSFSRSACGVFWTNHLMQRFGVGHWCFHVDMDEAFVFPGDDSTDLATFLAYLDGHGFGSVPAFMLDIYPETLEPSAGDPFGRSCYIDRDYTSMPCEVPPYTFVQGGLRSRMTGRSLMMTKAPLVKMTPDLWYLANNHQHTHLPVADVSAAVLHFKFIGDLVGRLDEAIDRGEHFMGARFYRALRSSIASPESAKLVSEHSVLYQGTSQLVDLGLLQTCTRWEEFRSERRS